MTKVIFYGAFRANPSKLTRSFAETHGCDHLNSFGDHPMLRITLPQLNQKTNTYVLPASEHFDTGDQQTFELPIDVYLKDVCPYQNTYFSRYLEWQGMCRERFLAEKLLAGSTFNGIFLTKCCHQEYIDETYAFQRVRVLLNTFQVKQCSSFLLFRFVVDEKLISVGYQQIVCAGFDRQIQRLPAEIVEQAKKFEISLDEMDDTSQIVLAH
jgi:acyl-CoA thioesterase FadM